MKLQIVYRRHSNNDLGEIVYLSSPGDLTSLNSSNGSCCSLVSNKPALVIQLGPGHTHLYMYVKLAWYPKSSIIHVYVLQHQTIYMITLGHC